MTLKASHKKRVAATAWGKLRGFFMGHKDVWMTAAVIAVMLVTLANYLAPSRAATEQAVMPLPAHFLEDQASLLSVGFAAAKNQYIEHLSQTMRIAQIRVVILPRVPGTSSLEDFTMRAAAQWKVGVNGIDNGLLLFIFKEEHKIRLEVGYGLESVMPDAMAYKLLSEQLVPAFSQGQFETGIEDYLDVLDKTLEASEAANQRASNFADMIPFVMSVLRTTPQMATKVWQVFIAADTQGRMTMSLIGVVVASILGGALIGIAYGVPALLMLPWRLYTCQTLRTFRNPEVRKQFTLKNFVARAPPVLVELAAELELGKILNSLYFLMATVVSIAFLFVGSSALVGGLGHYSGAGATLHWP